MSSQLQAFGSWRIILLNSDDLGDDGDVLTRVGENAAAFLPAGGGGNPFDQDLNTDDDVVFGSVTAPSISNDGDIDIAPTGNGNITIGNFDGGSFVRVSQNSSITSEQVLLQAHAPDLNSLSIGSDGVNLGSALGMWIVTTEGIDLNLYTEGGGDVALTVSGDLTINGTPGVTNAAIVVDGVTLSFTKGILTGVA